MHPPKVSVYITSYNQKEYLIEAIDSVLTQTMPPHELIIVDDASTDGSQEIIAKTISRFPNLVKPIYHIQNQGVSATRNSALRAVTGDYVTYLDGDDRYLPTKIEKEIDTLRENPHARMVYSNFYNIDESGQRLNLWADNERPPEGNIFRQTYGPRQTHFRCEMVDIQAIRETGYYDSNLKIYEDYDMRIRLTKKYLVAYCSEPLSERRRHLKSLSNAGYVEQVETLSYIYRKNIPLLNDLSARDRREVRKRAYSHIAGILRRSARQEIVNAQGSFASKRIASIVLLQSLKYQLSLDPKLMLSLLLPYKVYRGMAKSYLTWIKR